MNAMDIRNGEAADWAGLAEVFHLAVRGGAVLYTEAQRAAWSPRVKPLADWALRMSRQTVFVAEADGALIGFLSLEMSGYLDCAYILPGWQGRGVFRKLYEPLEAGARADGLRRISTHASLHAKPAFAAMGFSVMAVETVQMAGAAGAVWLPRFAMAKVLG